MSEWNIRQNTQQRKEGTLLNSLKFTICVYRNRINIRLFAGNFIVRLASVEESWFIRNSFQIPPFRQTGSRWIHHHMVGGRRPRAQPTAQHRNEIQKMVRLRPHDHRFDKQR